MDAQKPPQNYKNLLPKISIFGKFAKMIKPQLQFIKKVGREVPIKPSIYKLEFSVYAVVARIFLSFRFLGSYARTLL